jgi:acyl dehydratase
MMLKDLLSPQDKHNIGTFEFTPEKIVEFARQYDPQYFHVDAEAAKNSVFGGLCASGWHVTAAMMNLNVANLTALAKRLLAEGSIPPKIGPSPGFRNLKWLKPVFAGDQVTYFMQFSRTTPIPHRPGRFISYCSYEGMNQNGETVMQVECSVVEFE